MKNLAGLTLAELSKLPTKALLAAYNANASKPIKRFADHFSGFKRTKALWAALQGKPAAKAPEIKVALGGRTPAPRRSGEDRRGKARCKVLVAPVSKPTATKEYHSVLAAFIALGLPVVKHQRFRRQLKLAGKATFAEYTFTATY